MANQTQRYWVREVNGDLTVTLFTLRDSLQGQGLSTIGFSPAELNTPVHDISETTALHLVNEWNRTRDAKYWLHRDQ